MSIAIITRFKNERHIMYEWVHHHLLEGIDKIYMIDDHSDDDFHEHNKDWMDDLIAKDKIQLLKSKSPQKKDYDNYLDLIKACHTWVINIDFDEFIFCPKEDKTIKDMLLTKYKDASLIKVKWKLFSHRVKGQPKSLIENNTITHKDDVDPSSPMGMKCIGKTKNLNSILIHDFIYDKSPVVTDLLSFNDDIQINHYRTQSDEYLYGVKEQRGGGVTKIKYFKPNSVHLSFDRTDFTLINKRKELIDTCSKRIQINPKIHLGSSWNLRKTSKIKYVLLKVRFFLVELYEKRHIFNLKKQRAKKRKNKRLLAQRKEFV